MKQVDLTSIFCKALAAVLMASALASCATAIMGGAVVGGLVAVDRRTPGAQLEDETIELKGMMALRENLGDRAHVNLTSYNRRVLLTGEVPNAQDRQLVEKVTSGLPNVMSITNELAVMGSSSLTTRSKDTYLTGRVKAGLIDAKDLFATAFKVTTERGTVYLMGRVTQREADRATDIARKVSGVAKVVRVFDYITEDQLKALLPAEPKSDAKTSATK